MSYVMSLLYASSTNAVYYRNIVIICPTYPSWKNNHLTLLSLSFISEMRFLFAQDSPYSQEDKPVSSYLSYIIPSISFDGSNTNKYQNENKSPSAGYNYENFDYQDVPSDNYVDCSPVFNKMDSVKDSNDNNNNEDHTSRRSSSSSEVFEEANEQQMPQASKKSRLNLSDESTFISPELYEFLEICLPNIVKGRQWVLLYR